MVLSLCSDVGTREYLERQAATFTKALCSIETLTEAEQCGLVTLEAILSS